MRPVVVSIGVLLLTVCGFGCSGEPDDRPTVFPVSGIVTYKGKPVSGALVTFTSKDSPRPANATTNSNGKYSLTTFNFKDGAVAGAHEVSITKSTTPAATSDPALAKTQDLTKGPPAGYPTADKAGNITMPKSGGNELPAKYAGGNSSELKATVSASGKNEINFDLEE